MHRFVLNIDVFSDHFLKHRYIVAIPSYLMSISVSCRSSVKLTSLFFQQRQTCYKRTHAFSNVDNGNFHSMDAKDYLLTSSQYSQQFSACLWDYSTLNVMKLYRNGGTAATNCLEVIGDDYILTAEQAKPLLHAWLLNNQDVSKNIRLILAEPATCIAVCPKRVYLAVGMTCKIYIWHISSGKLLSVQQKNYQPITCIKFSSDGEFVLVGGQDGMVVVYNLCDLVALTNNYLAQTDIGQVEPIYVKSDHSLPITDLHVGGILNTSKQKTSREKCYQTQSDLNKFSCNDSMKTSNINLKGEEECDMQIYSLHIILNEHYYAVIYDKMGYIGNVVHEDQVNLTENIQMKFMKYVLEDWPKRDDLQGSFGRKSRFVTVSMDQTCRLYNLLTGENLLTLVFDEPLFSVIFDACCWQLYVGEVSGIVRAFNLQQPPRSVTHHVDRKMSLTFEGHTKKVTCLALNSCNSVLASGSDDNFVFTWDIKSRQILKKIEHKGTITNLKFVMAYENFFADVVKPKTIISTLERNTDFSSDFKIAQIQLDDIELSDDENSIEKQKARETITKENTRLRVINRQLYNAALEIRKKYCNNVRE